MFQPVKHDALASIESLWLIFSGDRLLVKEGESSLPHMRWQDIPFLHHYADQVKRIEHREVGGAQFDGHTIDIGSELVELAGWETISLRRLLTSIPTDAFGLVAKTWQYTHFLRTHRFCGRCGSKMESVDWEMAVHCHSCQHRCYPRVSPCIIVAIYSGDKILLARGVRHKEVNMYSTLAGFVESGESLEHAVHREVEEEVGVRVKNLEYFGSQPWPFPHSVMVGYIAEYAGGDIKIDDHEIDDAQWFDIHDLPNIPPKFSIAGQLIDAVVNRK